METICYRVWLLGVGLCVSFPGLLESSPIYLGGLKDGRFFFFWPHQVAWGIFPGCVEPETPISEARSLNP